MDAYSTLGRHCGALHAAHEAGIIASTLIALGKPAETPVAIVESASLPTTQHHFTTLKALSTNGFGSATGPVLLLIGAVYQESLARACQAAVIRAVA